MVFSSGMNFCVISLASAGAGKLKARFESMAKASDEENRKKVEEERARRQAKESREREEAKRRQQVVLGFVMNLHPVLICNMFILKLHGEKIIL